MIDNLKSTYEEGCLSVPDQFAEIDRPKKCEVEYLDYNGEKKLLKADGLLATCIQHEMDHLEGILFIEVPHVSDMFNFSLTDERFTIPHIYFFSEGTLSALLEKAGFTILQYRVFDASRNRSYLQVVAQKITQSHKEWTLSGPLDDVQTIIRKVKNNTK